MQTLGDSEGQGSLACRSPWGHKELDMTERLNNNKNAQQNLQKSKVVLQRPKQTQLRNKIVSLNFLISPKL